MECDTRWRVAYAADLRCRTATFDDGEIFLRHDSQRLVLLNARGHTVDARYVREGEWIDVGSIVSFPCHFAKIYDRLQVIGPSRGGAPASNGTTDRRAYGEGIAVHGHVVEVVVHGPMRPLPRLQPGPGVLGRGPGRHDPDLRHVGAAEANRSDPSGARVSTTDSGTKTSPTHSAPAFSDLDECLLHFWEPPPRRETRVPPTFSWWEGKIRGDNRSFGQVAASPPPPNPIPRRGRGGDAMRGDGFGAGRHGRGAGRFDRGRGRGHGLDNNVWKRKEDAGQSSSTRASGSGDTGFEKWEAAAGSGGSGLPRIDRREAAVDGDGGDKTMHQPRGKSPTPSRRGDPPARNGNPNPIPDACQICNLVGHYTAKCPQALCERCKKWECIPVMCGFQSKGQGFCFFHDYSIDRQPQRENTNVLITITEGFISKQDLQDEMGVYIGQGWRCSAHSIAPGKYVMRFPNMREVDRALFVEYITLKKHKDVVRITPWSDDMDCEGLLEIAWVRISKIPVNKRCEKNVAYAGGLVGATLEIDMSTLKGPSSVRAKIGCRSVDKLPSSAEGCMGGRFYRFQYEVEEVLVRNPITEEDTVTVKHGQENNPVSTPKRKRQDNSPEITGHTQTPGERGAGDYQGGKTCRLLSPVKDDGDDKDTSSTSESEDEQMLFLDKLAKENTAMEEKMQISECERRKAPVGNLHMEDTFLQDIQVTEKKPYKKKTSNAEVVTGCSQVSEMVGEVDPMLKVTDDYLVHLPSPDCNDEIIPTPPLIPEVNLRFSQRCAQGGQGDMMMKAMEVAKKKNMEGLQPEEEAKKLRQGAEMVKLGATKLMRLCERSRQVVEDAGEVLPW